MEKSSEAVWPEGLHKTLTDQDYFFLNFIANIEVIFTLISFVLFLCCAAWLAFRSNAKGRFLLLAAPLIVIIYPFLMKIIKPEATFLFPNGLMSVALTKFVISFAALTGAIGFTRLVWWIYRNPQ